MGAKRTEMVKKILVVSFFSVAAYGNEVGHFCRSPEKKYRQLLMPFEALYKTCL